MAVAEVPWIRYRWKWSWRRFRCSGLGTGGNGHGGGSIVSGGGRIASELGTCGNI